jgi:hypothetical protein
MNAAKHEFRYAIKGFLLDEHYQCHVGGRFAVRFGTQGS